MNTTLLIWVAGALFAGAAAGYALRRLVLLSQKSTLEIELKEKRLQAKEVASNLKESAQKEAELPLESFNHKAFAMLSIPSVRYPEAQSLACVYKSTRSYKKHYCQIPNA